jgi:crossover junction endodeoxyribonuclease RuvC
MLYLGIDQSLQSPGLAIVDEQGKAIQVSHLSVSEKKRGVERLATIVAWVTTNVRLSIAQQGCLVAQGCLEGYSVNSSNRPYDLGEISGAIRVALYQELGLVLTVVEPTRLKKFATGKGIATKEEVIHAVNTEWKASLHQTDEADAYVLAQIAKAMSTQSFTRRCQAEVVRDLLNPPRKRRRLRTTPTKNL